MTNPNKARGSSFELDVARYMAAHGFPYAERRYGAGAQADKGDINGLPGVVIECKNHAAITLAAWMGELETECWNATVDLMHPPRGILVVKRRGKGVERAYVVEELRSWCEHNKENDATGA